jgi:predicted secreted protein
MPSATALQIEGLQAQIEHQKNRIANLAKVHELTQFQTGLYNHPRLALAAITKACSFDFSDADKEKVRLMVRSHSSTGNYSWKVSIREWVDVIYTLTGISIPQELLAYWLAEWGYKIVASGGKRLTQTYSVEMLPLNKSNKLKIAERLKIA